MDFSIFKEKVRGRFRLDLNSYKENQLKRRLDALMVKLKLNTADYYGFFKLLAADRSAYLEFLDTLTINVSEFFRDKAMFEYLENTILPVLISKSRTLRIWSAACSNGAEPYSIAIILEDITPCRRHSIEGSDIDRNILKTAAAGCYSEEQVRNVGEPRLKKYFKTDGGSYYINENIKKQVGFRQHDLLIAPYGAGYNLIICRNVTIYFTREAQEKINNKFYRALETGGVLFIGASEMIFNYHELGFEKLSTCFYRKK